MARYQKRLVRLAKGRKTLKLAAEDPSIAASAQGLGLVDDYIAKFPAPTRKLLQQLRRTIRAAAPAATETLSYGIPTFDVNGKHLVHFAGFARHVGFYPGAPVAVEFARDFARFKSGKGSVQFPLDQPLPLALVRRVVRFRLAEVRALRAVDG